MKTLTFKVAKHEKEGKTFFTAYQKGGRLKHLITGLEEDKNYSIKLSSKSPSKIPQEEGLYFCDIDESSIWFDKREGISYPSVWVSCELTNLKKYVAKN